VLRVFNALGPAMPENSLPGTAQRRLSEAVAASASRIELGPLGRCGTSSTCVTSPRPSSPPVASRALDATLVNVASGMGHTARELVEALARAVGFAGEIAEGAAGIAPLVGCPLASRRHRPVARAESSAGSRFTTSDPSVELMTAAADPVGQPAASTRSSQTPGLLVDERPARGSAPRRPFRVSDVGTECSKGA